MVYIDANNVEKEGEGEGEQAPKDDLVEAREEGNNEEGELQQE